MSVEVETPVAAPEPSSIAPEQTAVAVEEAAPPANPNGLRKGKPLPPSGNDEALKAAKKAAFMKHIEKAKTESAGTPAPAQPATPAAVTPTAPKEKKEADETPTPAPVAKTEPAESEPKAAPETAKSKAIKVMSEDKDGKPVELSLAFDKCVNALLRDGMSQDAIRHLSDKNVLDFGSRKFLAQSKADREYQRQVQQRREAEAKAQTPVTGTPAQAAAPVEAPPPRAAEAQPQSQPPQAPLPQPETDADFQALAEQVGIDAARLLWKLHSRTGTPANTNPPEEMTRINAELQQQRQLTESTVNLLMADRFDQAFDNDLDDYPQLEAEGNEQLRDAIKANAQAIARSGRFANPLERTSFKTIYREARNSVLGDLQAETHARQLVGRQKQQARGQIVPGTTREQAPAAALSPRDLKRQAMLTLMQTGDKDKAKRVMTEAAVSSG